MFMYTSNQLADLWKESLNSDGHLYLQKNYHSSPQMFEHKKDHDIWH
jgi:hypothetical protein